MKRAIIDLSSVVWTALLAGKDSEYGKTVEFDGKQVHINSAGYGFDNALNHIEKVMADLSLVPHQMTFVVEGKDSKRERTSLHPGYKAGRGRPPEAYEEFVACRDKILRTFLDLGSLQAWQDGGLEADDVIGYLAKNLDGERWIVSYDKDLAQLVGGDIHHLRGGKVDENPFGDFEHRLIPVWIALVGDSADKIPGAKGFGAVAAQDILFAFGNDGLELMEDLIKTRTLLRLEEDLATLPKLQKIIDDAGGVYMSYELARLRIERVNTLRRPLQWKVGMVKPSSQCEEQTLRKWAGQARLIHAGNYAEARAFFAKQVARTPEFCLDLETHVDEQSEEWLERRSTKGGGVDVIGSMIVGCGLCFGPNGEYHFYLTTKHVEEEGIRNLTLAQVREFLELIPKDKITVAQNAAGFELPVMYNAFGEAWKDNGWRGMFPNMVDSRIAATYWDEDQPSHGLKQMSKLLLEYDQETYEHVTTVDGVQYKMNELTARHVLNYGLDDVVTAMALWRFYRVIMELDGTLDAFMRLEQKPMYLSALGYAQGVPISLQHLNKLRQTDDEAFVEHGAVLDELLLGLGWDGTVCPVYTEITPASVKEAVLLLTGLEADFRVRLPAKMSQAMDEWADGLIEESEDNEIPGSRIRLLSAYVRNGDVDSINELVARHFSGRPKFDVASPKQVARLVYERMGLPVRLRNKPTDVMRAKGIHEGTARTDDDALKMAQKMGDVTAGTLEHRALSALIEMKSINTKRGLYYEPYPAMVHWKTRRIHPELVQSGTNTRRWAARNPNIQQLDSAPGGIRSVVLPHHRDAVVVSLDESGQEVRQAADYCRDPNLLSCFMGTAEEIRDVHSIVGSKILSIPYRDLRSGADLPEGAGKVRSIAKTVLFASFYGAGAAKIGENLGISEGEAQDYIDAIYAQFPDLAKWKSETERFAEKHGWVPVHGGTVRHLRKALLSDNNYESSKALRQASNARIQGAGANQLKTIMSAVWDSDIIERYDYRWYFPVHDETVHSVGRGDVAACVKELHGLMTKQFLGLVPSASSIGLGPTFGDLIEIGETYDVGLIEKALNDIFEMKEAA